MKKIKRNSLCPCGSGKKFKKCCINKKPRTMRVQYDFKDPVSFSSPNDLVFQDGRFQIKDINGKTVLPEKTKIMNCYERANKKKKLLNALEFDGSELMDVNKALLAKYNVVFAIDTNTSVNDGDSLSISTIIRLELSPDRNKFFLVPIRFYEFRNSGEKIENVAWSILMQELVAETKKIDLPLEIGIIVDSDLGNIDKFQQREKPIIDHFFIPDNISLIYASADSGSEFWVNKAIKCSDKWAKKIEKEMMSVTEDYFHITDSKHFSHFRSQHAKLQATKKHTKKELYKDVDSLFVDLLDEINVYIGDRIEPDDKAGLGNLARYIIRACFSQERLVVYFN